MTFEIEINGRLRTVRVERTDGHPDRYRLTVDGHPCIVDAVRVEDDTLSLVLPEQGHASHEIGFSEGLGPNEVTVYTHSGTLQAVVNGRRSHRGAMAAAAGDQRIVAPMPGKVLRVLVAPGDEVKPRQPIVVVEAMKMENELSSPRGGRVKDVVVGEGVSVEAGRLLVVVE
jgi:biotin carboxyl carrier protein